MSEGKPRRVAPHVLLTPNEITDAVAYLRTLPYDIPVVIDVETSSGTNPDGTHITAFNNNLLWVGVGASGHYFLIPTDHPHGNTIVREHKVDITADQLPFDDPDRYTPSTRGLIQSSKLGMLDPDLKVSKRKLQRRVPSRFHPRPKQVGPDKALALLRPLLFDKDRALLGHNIKFDLASIAKYLDGELPPGPYHDTIVLQHVLDENKVSYVLKDLIHEFFRVNRQKNPDWYPNLGTRVPELGMDDAARYLSKDLHYCYLYWRHLWKSVDPVREIYDFEMQQLYRVIMEMEQAGFRMDTTLREDQAVLMEQQLDGIAEQVSFLPSDRRQITRADLVNINTRRELMFDPVKGMGLKPRVITKTGLHQLNKATLEYYAERGEMMATHLLDFSKLEKIKGTFVDGLGTWLDRENRIHTGYKLHGTVTGRLSSAEPNLQQLPKRSTVKQMFIPSEGRVLVCGDYSQVELRVAGYLSKDPGLISTFLNGGDPHAAAAANMYQVALEDVTEHQRDVGKTQNFAVLYGAGEDKIAAVAGCSKQSAKKLIARYYQGFPGLEPWKAKLISEAKRRGDRANSYNHPPYVVIPPYGRRRRLHDLFSTEFGPYSRAERQAVNSVVQGFASYITKTAMVQMRELFQGQPVQLLAQVHDEIVLEVDRDYAEEALRLMQDVMENQKLNGKPILGDIPLEAVPTMGATWAEAK